MIKPILIDVRVVAATNQDIEAAVANGKFRGDLYYRLNVVTISLLPLCEWGDDVLILANVFLNQYNAELEKRIRGFTPTAADALIRHPWPGNVRDFQNRIRRGIVVAREDQLTEHDIGFASSDENLKTLQEAKDQIESDLVRAVLEQN